MCIRFINKGGKAPKLQEKSVTITNNGTTNVIPDTGYDGLNNVAITTNVDTSGYNAKFVNPTIANNVMINSLLTEAPTLDTSIVTHFTNMFNGCSSLTTVPLYDLSNAITASYMFYGCSSLISIPEFNTSNITDMSYMFNNCSSLTTIPILNTSKVTTMNSMFSYANNLSNDSLNNILAMCINVTSAYTRAKTLKEIGISRNNATKCTNLSNYQAFLNAGWTTGY